MKMKNLLTGSAMENVFRADDKFDVQTLEKTEVTYSYFADPVYVFMDKDYNQFEVDAENMGDAMNYLEDGMPCEVVFYDGKAISVELPTMLVREVEYTEPAVRGDTSGKVMKPARSSRPASNCRCRRSSKPATRSRSIPAPANTAAASRAEACASVRRRRTSGCRLQCRPQRCGVREATRHCIANAPAGRARADSSVPGICGEADGAANRRRRDAARRLRRR